MWEMWIEPFCSYTPATASSASSATSLSLHALMKLMHRLVALKVLRLQSPRANESHNAMLLQGTMDSTCERSACCSTRISLQCVKCVRNDDNLMFFQRIKDDVHSVPRRRAAHDAPIFVAALSSLSCKVCAIRQSVWHNISSKAACDLRNGMEITLSRTLCLAKG